MGAVGSFFPDNQCTIAVSAGGLVAYYKMEEASGTRVDSFGSNDLTAVGLPGVAVGISGSAAHFTLGSTQYLQSVNPVDLRMGRTSFSICYWAYIDSINLIDNMWLVNKSLDGSAANSEFFTGLITGATSLFKFFTSDGSGTQVVTASNFGAVSINTWYFVACIYDSANQVIKISINNGDSNSTAQTTGILATTLNFVVGRLGNDASTGYHNGRIDELGVWKRALTNQELSDLYQGGVANTYSINSSCVAKDIYSSAQVIS